MSDRPSDSLSSAEALFAEWLGSRRVAGDTNALESLCRAHPREAAELRRLWVYWEGLRPVIERVGLGTGAPSLAQRIERVYGSAVDPDITLDAAEHDDAAPLSSTLLRRLAKNPSSRYKLQGEVARGGMGAILKVYDEDLRRNLAMKVILGKSDDAASGETPPIDKRILARFLEEAQVTAQLDHPGIAPVHELGLDSDGRVYFTMKLIKGRDLKQIFDLVFDDKEGWTEARALGVLVKVCEAMAYAHKKGVIHRDLKPANVMVGSFGEVYVMDWGLARVVGREDRHDVRIQMNATPLTTLDTERRETRGEEPDSPLFTMDGDVVGTPAYMSPEQARGEIENLGPRSDVYALGAILYHLLARSMPYAHGKRVTNRTMLALVLQGAPTPLRVLRRNLPREIIAICEKAMARDREKRYASTLELAEDLRAYQERRPVRAYRPTIVARLLDGWKRQNRLGQIGALCTYSVVAIGWLDNEGIRFPRDWFLFSDILFIILVPVIGLCGVGLMVASMFQRGPKLALLMQIAPLLCMFLWMSGSEVVSRSEPLAPWLSDYVSGNYPAMIEAVLAIPQDKRSYEQNYYLAIAYCNTGAFNESLAVLDWLVGKAPSGSSDVLMRDLKARALLAVGDVESAKAALDVDPNEYTFGQPSVDPMELRIALGHALGITNGAIQWVNAMREELVLRTRILDAIRQDTSHSEFVRSYAKDLAEKLTDEPGMYNGIAWDIAVSPSRSAHDYDKAARLAGAAVELQPSAWPYVNTLGVCLYRCGRFDEAVATLLRSVELAGEANKDHPIDVAYLAMSRFQLGDRERAMVGLEALEETMRQGPFSDDQDCRNALQEARALITER